MILNTKYRWNCHQGIIEDYCDINPLPDDKILDWSKFKQIADDILKCI